MQHRRILIIGTSAAGKSTFARELSRRTGIAHIELDAFFHAPNWQQVPLEEFQRRVREAVENEEWILDGNYFGRIRHIVWPRTELILWLDYAFPRVFYRACKRTLARILTREELWSGNRETWRNFFSSQNMPLWVIRTHFGRRKGILRYVKEHPEIHVVQLSSPASAKAWIEQNIHD